MVLMVQNLNCIKQAAQPIAKEINALRTKKSKARTALVPLVPLDKRNEDLKQKTMLRTKHTVATSTDRILKVIINSSMTDGRKAIPRGSNGDEFDLFESSGKCPFGSSPINSFSHFTLQFQIPARFWLDQL